jgi:hypothetical protein
MKICALLVPKELKLDFLQSERIRCGLRLCPSGLRCGATAAPAEPGDELAPSYFQHGAPPPVQECTAQSAYHTASRGMAHAARREAQERVCGAPNSSENTIPRTVFRPTNSRVTDNT